MRPLLTPRSDIRICVPSPQSIRKLCVAVLRICAEGYLPCAGKAELAPNIRSRNPNALSLFGAFYIEIPLNFLHNDVINAFSKRGNKRKYGLQS